MTTVHLLRVCALQAVAGGQRERSHGDGPPGAPAGPGVAELRGRSSQPEWAGHGGAAFPHPAA